MLRLISMSGLLGRRMPEIGLILLSFLYLACLFQGLGNQPLLHTDEQLTAERSREFLLHKNPFVVTENFQPVFNKPPLQYWLTAPLVWLLGANEVAVRLWPLVFAIGCLWVTAWLAVVVWPEFRWGILFAPLALCLNSLFLSHSRSAMLDTGQTFFCTASIACALRAVEDKRWWMGAGFAAGLGTLQKSPLSFAILVALIVLIGLFHKGLLRAHKRQLVIGLSILGVLAFVWPLLQVAQNGFIAWQIGYCQQIASRFLQPAMLPEENRPFVYIWEYFRAWKSVGLVSIVLIATTFLSRKVSNKKWCVLGVFAGVYFVGLYFARPVYPRYLITILPVLAVGISTVICKFGRISIVCSALFALLLVSTSWPSNMAPVRSEFSNNYSEQIQWSLALRAHSKKAAKVALICQDNFSMSPRVPLFYADLRSAVIAEPWKIVRSELPAWTETEDLLAVVETSCWQKLQRRFRCAQILEDLGKVKIILFQVNSSEEHPPRVR